MNFQPILGHVIELQQWSDRVAAAFTGRVGDMRNSRMDLAQARPTMCAVLVASSVLAPMAHADVVPFVDNYKRSHDLGLNIGIDCWMSGIVWPAPAVLAPDVLPHFREDRGAAGQWTDFRADGPPPTQSH